MRHRLCYEIYLQKTSEDHKTQRLATANSRDIQHLRKVPRRSLSLLKKGQSDYFCSTCSISLTTKQAHEIHLECNKRKRLAAALSKPPPDEFDPNNHCSQYDKNFITRSLYRAHLWHSHKMSLTPLRTTRLQQNPNILPNANNPDFYCASCDYKFALKGGFRQHLVKAHRMNLIPLKREKTSRGPKILLRRSNHQPFFCGSCDTSKINDCQHMRNSQKESLTEPSKNSKHIAVQYVIPSPLQGWCTRQTENTKD